MKRLLLALTALFAPVALSAQPPAAPSAPVQAQGIVSAADPRAVAAGTEMLRQGGSSVDAAIATMLALNVVEPQSSGIGGGAFLVHHDAVSGAVATIDGREAAPMAADGTWFYGEDGKPLPFREAVPGGRSVGVPGVLRLMALAHERYGKLLWAQLFEPAIRLARGGFVMTPRLHESATKYGGHVTGGVRDILTDANGDVVPAGTWLQNPEQAALFEQLAKLGADAFYVGPIAQKVGATVNGAARNPSRMTAGDLVTYAAKERDPVCASYRRHRICSMGPPSSGGITVLMILKQLERFDMAKLGKESPTAWHLFAESSRLAYADRNFYVGDPDYVQVPVRGLLDRNYLAGRSALISPTSTMAKVEAGTPPGAPARRSVPASEVPGTTDLAIADRWGNVTQVTTTVEGPFGSGLSVDGVMLNNELTDFDFVPDDQGRLVANRVEGGKRPRSSMAPTIVYGPDGAVRLAVGAAGGSTIIAQVAKAIIGVIDWKLTAQEAIGLGLVYAPGPVATVEQGTSLEALAPGMEALGEQVRVAPLGLKANAIERVGGRWLGAADPRSEGIAMHEDGTMTRIVRMGGAKDRPSE